MPRSLPHPRRRVAGMSLVELLISLTFFVMGLGAFLQSLVDSFRLGEESRELVLATHAARAQVERLASEDFALVFALCNGTPDDDPAGKDVTHGAFAVEGLRPASTDGDALVGEILFPVDPDDASALSELVTADFLGRAMDLDLDGDATDADVSDNYALLPVIVRLRWQSANGAAHTYEIRTLLTDL